MSADRVYAGFKAKLARLRTERDFGAIIALWDAFERFYARHDLPQTDNWWRVEYPKRERWRY